MLDVYEIAIMIGAAATSALLGYVFLFRAPEPHAAHVPLPDDPVALLFDDGVLHHATQSALNTYALLPGAHVWDDLRQSLLPRFPQFPETSSSDALGSMTMLPKRKDDPGLVTLHWRDTMCWVDIAERPDHQNAAPAQGAHDQTFKDCCDTSPHPAWETRLNGTISWHNHAYATLAKRCVQDRDDAIFALPDKDDDEITQDPPRISAETENGTLEWFEVCSHDTTNGMLHHATSVTQVMRAEDAQRMFVQTLAKTFAQLPVGLAIFDVKGQLSIFNPALVDLSGLQPHFLAGQPTMLSFFDALRENRRMPEPKNYNAWRKDITAMINAATDGQYHETWTLEDGRTYAVQGRPHPDGATAFLIEDISAEVTLTRNFRTEVEQYEALLDAVDDALVVFSSNGVITYCNSIYRKMWGQNPEAAFADVTIIDAIDLWQSKATADWSKIPDFVKTLSSKAALNLDVKMGDNQHVNAHLAAIGSDATLIRFSPVSVVSQVAQKTTV